MPWIRSSLRTVRVGCAPRASQARTRSSSSDDGRGVGLRVVVPDGLDHAAVARRALVGDDDAPDRVLAAADAGEAEADGHAAQEGSGSVELSVVSGQSSGSAGDEPARQLAT